MVRSHKVICACATGTIVLTSATRRTNSRCFMAVQSDAVTARVCVFMESVGRFFCFSFFAAAMRVVVFGGPKWFATALDNADSETARSIGKQANLE